ncbi:MAG: WD40/YVTN/BNR-like repeat-containing protein [Thermomicrobiales bacterium]
MSHHLDGLLRWRCIGPFRGGRVLAGAGSHDDPATFYFGGAAGGVWKTDDAGTYWRCVSDGFLSTSSIGALAVAPSDSNVIYAGTGETTIRSDVSHGDGVYRSTDAGRTWRNVGLRETRHIGKIRVHPDTPDTLWVAALGHAFGPNPERGVFKSVDGGETWRHVLFVSDNAGAVDLSVDPTNPRILYAAVWEARRSFSQISSGGPESGLWQSVDGGETWRNISARQGLPAGTLGKIAVAASPAAPGRVWALIEHAKEGGLYRSDDLGQIWEKVSDNQHLLSRAWYYTHLTADPQDGETVYVNNLAFWKSADGGKTFAQINTPHGDNHDLWIDPANNRRMIQGNDGGATVSHNGGVSFSTTYNQPTAQFYHLATDSREPYTVYGTQQDNSSIAVPSRVNGPAITPGKAFVAGSGESGHIVVHPDNPDIVYVGAIGSSPGGGNALQRYDRGIDQIRLITTWPEEMAGQGAGEHKHRFAWTYPIVISPHDANTIYIGGDRVFKSVEEGQSWQPISPDLTRADPETLKPTGGPVNLDAIGAEVYATVFAFAESPHEAGTLWAGSDDGLLHISRDGGGAWSDITPKEMPEWTMISCIEPSPFDPATAYVAGTRYKLDDYKPYLYVTRDYGRSWKRIDEGIREDDFTRVIRCDPARKGLLYAGTETGVHVSFDDGVTWDPFQLNLPVSPVHELLVKGSDLIAGTHGRSIWIFDDLTPLRVLAEGGATGKTALMPPRETVRALPGIDWSDAVAGSVNYLGGLGGGYTVATTPDGEAVRTHLDAGENPPRGVIVTYRLSAVPDEPLTLAFRSADGGEIRSFTSRKADDPTIAKELRAPAKIGWNRFVWDMRHAPVTKIEGKDPAAEEAIPGPIVAPGAFTVTLKSGADETSQPFTIVKPANIAASQADLDAQSDLGLRIHRQLDRTVVAVNRMRDLRAQLDGWATRAKDRDGAEPIAGLAKSLGGKVLEIEKTLLVPDLRPGWADRINNGARLLEKLAGLPAVPALGDYRPTDAAEAVCADLTARIETEIARFDALIRDDLPAFNAAVANAQLGAVTV